MIKILCYADIMRRLVSSGEEERLPTVTTSSVGTGRIGRENARKDGQSGSMATACRLEKKRGKNRHGMCGKCPSVEPARQAEDCDHAYPRASFHDRRLDR